MSEWYHQAEQALSETAVAVQDRRPLVLSSLERLAADLVASLQWNDELVVEALSGRSGSPLITNLINVAIFGTKVGIGLGYYGEELQRLAFAGLVHDIGLFVVPHTLITKNGRLTQEERAVIEQHPEFGYRVMEQCGSDYHWLARVIRQVHERFNGQGYPKRLKGREINEMAQICGVVDVFDALVSERPYRRRLLPHEAVKELLVTERATFPREILKALVEQLSVYPLGTMVRLTTGDVGIVAKVNSRYPLRPVVRVDDEQGREGAEGCQFDLSRIPLIAVVETVNPPAVGRVRFTDPSPRTQSSASPTVASDHFTALLESLDAIALTMQGVVTSRRAVIKESGAGRAPSVAPPTPPSNQPD
ncbi:MAG: HD domain-containing protein [Nitrospira sp.]|nr:HD domain-containing protein [Nitrospira sp.]